MELLIMKTIEERAKAASEGYDDDGYSAGLYMGYKVGATEQRKIDIMHIRQFLEREVAYNSSMTFVDGLLIEELCKVIEE